MRRYFSVENLRAALLLPASAVSSTRNINSTVQSEVWCKCWALLLSHRIVFAVWKLQSKVALCSTLSLNHRWRMCLSCFLQKSGSSRVSHPACLQTQFAWCSDWSVSCVQRLYNQLPCWWVEVWWSGSFLCCWRMMCWLLALAIKGWSVPSKGPSRPQGSLGTSCCCLRGGRKRNVCCPHGPDKLQETGEWTDCPTETKLHHCGTEQVSCSFLFLLFVSENVEEAQS